MPPSGQGAETQQDPAVQDAPADLWTQDKTPLLGRSDSDEDTYIPEDVVNETLREEPGESPSVARAWEPSEPDASIDLSGLPPLLVVTGVGLAESVGPFNPGPEELGRWQAMIGDYEREAKAIGGEARAATLYLEIGRLWEEQLSNPRNAAMAYQRAFHLNPKDQAVLHASRRLFTEVGNWGMVIQILQAEIDCTDRREKRATLLSEKGTILEDKLRSTEEAQKAFHQALDVWSAEPLAVNALERLHTVRREYEPLYGVYKRALEVAVRPDRRLPLLVAAAQVAEDRLGDPQAAIAHHQEILRIDPTNVLALGALRRLLQHANQWGELVAVLTSSAEMTEGREDAAQYLLSAACIEHERLHLPDRALATLLRALECAPENLGVLREIEWLYAQSDRYDEVVKVLRREVDLMPEPRERVPLLYKLGSVLEEHLGLFDEAIPAFEEAVRLMPSYVPARQALGRLFEKAGRWRELADLFELEVRLEEDVGIRVAKLFKLAEIFESKLECEDDCLRVLSDLLSLKADYMPARKLLEGLLTARGAWAELIALFEQELEFTEDRDQRIFLLDRVAVMAEEKLGALEQAAGACKRILDAAPGHLHAIRTLARLAARQERWDEVLKMMELEVQASSDQNEIVAILHRAGVVTEEKLGDAAGAITFYEKVLSLSPTYLPALESLGRLYHHQRRWSDLLSMYQREVEVSKSPEHLVALLFRMGDLLIDRIQDDPRAVDVYEQILVHDPQSLPALRALSEIHARNGANEKLVEVLTREAVSLKDPNERAQTLFRVAEVCEVKLDRADRAAEVYQDALRLGHGHDASLRALVRIYSAEGMWNALSRALRTAYEHATGNDAKADILVRCAEVASDKLGNLDSAAENLELALELGPENLGILNQLERISIARRDWPRAVAIAEILSEHEVDPRLYAARQVRIATMKETQLEPTVSGADHYRRALERVPDHPVALRALEVAYRRMGAWDALLALYHREALVTLDPARKVNLYARAGDLAEHRLEKDDVASSMYEAALDVVPTHLPSLRGRRRIAERRNEPGRILECISRERGITADPQRERDLLFEEGRLYEERFQDLQKAVSSYEAVLAIAPSHVGVFGRLETIYGTQKAWLPLIALLKRHAKAIDEPEDQARLYLAAGQVAEDRLGDKQAAIAEYREVLSRERMHPTALVRIGRLFLAEEMWDEAVDVLHRTLAVTKDPTVQVATFRSLGVIYQEHRLDLVKSVQCFQAAVQADPTDGESLGRLAVVYRAAKDWNSSVNVLLRLAEVEPDAARKVKTLLDLARIYETELSDRPNAVLATRKALEVDPASQDAVLHLSEIYEREQNWPLLAETTTAYVRTLAPDQKERALPLHLKLADVFETKLRDDARAISALRVAMEVDPKNAEAIEGLARLYSKTPETFHLAVDSHRRLLQLDPFRIQSYRAMHQMFVRRSEYDKAFVIAEILVFLRAQAQDEDLYYHEHKSKVPSHAAGVLSPEDHSRLVTHPGERGAARSVFEILGLELPKAFPSDLAKYELGRADRHGPKSDLPLRRLADELAKVLTAPPFEVCITKKLELGFFLENDKVPALIIGSGVGRRVQEKDQRFMVTRLLERLKGGHQLFDVCPPEDLFWAMVKMVVPGATCPIDPARVEAMQKRVVKVLSGKARSSLTNLGPSFGGFRFDGNKHRLAAVHTANRAGLALTNDIEVAIRSIAKEYPDIRPVFADARGAASTIGRIAEVRELLTYAVSEEYFAVRAKLGFSIQG